MNHCAGGMPALRNLLEPLALVRHFLAHPPAGFCTLTMPSGTPAFVARFDLLTTADDRLRKPIAALPLYRYWSRWLRPRTCFIGTTVSEYALFPATMGASALIKEWLTNEASRQPFMIVKDIPQQSPLLDQASNAQANAICAACEEADFVMIEGQALAWVSIDFECTDDYLARLSSGRRRDIRRKLRARDDLQIEEIQTGAELFRDARVREEFYARYLEVYAQSDLQFDRLSRDFFDALLLDHTSGGIVFVYRHHAHMIGWNLCFIAGDLLIDKYIGLAYPAAREQNLYFVSWMHNLDYACRRGLGAYVAGWTDPEIKAYLGARFTFTRHAVRPRSRLLRAVLRRMAGRFQRDRDWSEAQSAHGSSIARAAGS